MSVTESTDDGVEQYTETGNARVDAVAKRSIKAGNTTPATASKAAAKTDAVTSKFMQDSRAQGGNMKNMVGTVVSIVVGAVIVAQLAPVALDSFFEVDTAEWSTSLENLFLVIPVIIVIALFMLFVQQVDY